MSLLYKIVPVLGFVSLTAELAAQDSTIGQITIASPVAASLGKYSDVPVSYHTGLPQIEIPIYTIRSGSIQLPISLSYHASGLKVQELSGNVGAGWSLNAGGVITRTVVGAPDDRGLNAAHTTKGYYTDYGYNRYLFTTGNGACGGSGPPCPVGANYPADDISIANGVKDGEPDLYFFNFNGHAGKFYFNDDRTVVVVPGEDLRIQVIYPFDTIQNSPLGIQGFILTTSDGTRYYFGKNQNNDGNIDAIEITTYITTHALANTGQGAVSSWFLNKIVSGDSCSFINLIYKPDQFSFYTLSMFPVVPMATNPNPYNLIWSANQEYDLVKDFINGVRLSKILFANGEVDFQPGIIRADLGDYRSQIIGDVPNSQSSALGSIQIKDNGGFCKKDSFYCSYFRDSLNTITGFFSSIAGNIRSDTYRLRLDSLQESSCDQKVRIPPYKFYYFPELVPRRLSFGIDHWGFYNGVATNSGLIPDYVTKTGNSYYQFKGANRDAAWPAMRGGTLQKIIYPMGGSVRFDFEPHDVYANYNRYQKNMVASASVGYDGSVQNSGALFTTSSNSAIIYEMSLSNNLTTGGGTLQLVDPTHQSAGSFFSNAGSGTTSTWFTLPANRAYSYIFYKNSNDGTGHGLTGTLFSWTPVTVTGNIMVGGLRIKTITRAAEASTNNDQVTNFSYTTGGTQSSGILYSRPTYVQMLRNDVLKLVGFPAATTSCSVNGCASCDGSSITSYYQSPSSIRPMEFTQGEHIGYNEVRVTQANNGYSVYRYYGSNIWDNVVSDVAIRYLDVSVCSSSVPNYPAAPLPFDFIRGELKYEGHFNQAGQLLRDVFYYPEYVLDSLRTPGLIVQPVFSNALTQLWSTEYWLQSGRKTKMRIDATDYQPGSLAITTSTISYFGSPFHHQLTRQVTSTSTNDTLSTNLKYAFDFRLPCDTISNGWSGYTSIYTQNLSNFYAQLNTCKNSSGWNCKWINYQQWRFNNALNRSNYVKTRVAAYGATNSRFSSCQLAIESLSDTLLRPLLRMQRQFDNPPIEVSGWRNENLIHSMFTSFDTSATPLGFVAPKSVQSLDIATLSPVLSVASVSGKALTRDSRYRTRNSYIFNSGRPIQEIGPGGTITSYLWDYPYSDPVARIAGAKANQVAYTSFETNAKGNWTFAGTPFYDSSAITGLKVYAIDGSNTITKQGLTSSTIYTISYWAKNSTGYSIPGSMPGFPVKGRSVNGWTYFEHRISGQSSVTISGSGSIDELRLYPQGALMETFAYSPLLGITARCGVNSAITYYEYDALGRLTIIRDQDRNIVKKICYNYAGQKEDCGLNN